MSAGARPVAAAFGGLVALVIAMGIGRFVYTPILPFMVTDIPLSEAQAGLVGSANYLGYLVGALAAAWPGIPGRRRTWMLGALLASTATTALSGIDQPVILLSFIRFAGGVASAFALVFASTLVLERLATAGRAELSPIPFAGVGTGIALSSVVVAWQTSQQMNWQSMWLANAGLSLVLVPLVAWLLGPMPRHLDEHVAQTKAHWSGPLIRLVTSYGLFGFGYVITATFLAVIVRSSEALQPVEPYIWLTVGVAGIPSVAFWSYIGKRLGNGNAVALACLAESVGVALSVTADSIPAVVLAASLLGGTIMGISAQGLVHARYLAAGGDPRTVFALMTACFGVGQAVGPTFAGFAYGFGDSFLLPSSCAAGALVAAALLAVEWESLR